jgi:hypothetical protein
VRLDVVAIDLASVALHWVQGTLDDERGRLAPVNAPGLVPEGLQSATLLLFNGGFQPRHGRWGIAAGGVVLQEPKPEGCAIAAGNGAARNEVWMGPWSESSKLPSDFEFVRQTPPCLVRDRELHPDLAKGRGRRWGGHDPTRKTRRRSALGLDEQRKILYYAVGTEAEPIDLARGMLAVGSRTALQLDINWNWTRCLLPGPDEDGRIRVQEPLLEGMAYGKREYFARPSERDFFFVTRLRPEPSKDAPAR